MADIGKKYRVIFYDGEVKEWKVGVFNSKAEATAWAVGHPGALLIRFIDASGTGNTSFETLEEAWACSKRIESIRPRVDGVLPQIATELLYSIETVKPVAKST